MTETAMRYSGEGNQRHVTGIAGETYRRASSFVADMVLMFWHQRREGAWPGVGAYLRRTPDDKVFPR